MGLTFQGVTWTLVSEDDASTLEGQYEPENVTENIAGAWAQQGTLGLDQPILQFVGGELDTITLDVTIFARFDPAFKLLKSVLFLKDEDFDVGPLLEQIRALPRAVPELGRPMVYLFSVGEQLSQRVIVKSVGGIRYGSFRPVKPLGLGGGEVRGAKCSFELWRYEPFNGKALVSAGAESLVTPTKEGETYEHIARRVHRDPILGEALRRRNPSRRTLAPGDLVHVPDAKILRRELLPLTPQSVFLRAGDAQRANLQTTIEVHGAAVRSHVIREDF